MENVETEYPHYFLDSQNISARMWKQLQVLIYSWQKKKKNEHDTFEKQTDLGIRSISHSLTKNWLCRSWWAPSKQHRIWGCLLDHCHVMAVLFSCFPHCTILVTNFHFFSSVSPTWRGWTWNVLAWEWDKLEGVMMQPSTSPPGHWWSCCKQMWL